MWRNKTTGGVDSLDVSVSKYFYCPVGGRDGRNVTKKGVCE